MFCDFFIFLLFQHTAARRRLGLDYHPMMLSQTWFQHTAARRRLGSLMLRIRLYICRFNTQPPEGGWFRLNSEPYLLYSFNTQPPEGGWRQMPTGAPPICCFNTQPPEGGWLRPVSPIWQLLRFQHTADRRRLGVFGCENTEEIMFQHTADRRRLGQQHGTGGAHPRFNTQPPEGGWIPVPRP